MASLTTCRRGDDGGEGFDKVPSGQKGRKGKCESSQVLCTYAHSGLQFVRIGQLADAQSLKKLMSVDLAARFSVNPPTTSASQSFSVLVTS